MTSVAERRPDWAILLASLLVGLGLGAAYFFGFPERQAAPNPSTAPGQTTPSLPAPVQGAPAPDFQLTNLEGESVRLSELEGRVVLLNFWATWCGPCRVEMPAIQARYEAYADKGLVVLAVNFDEPREDVVDFRDELELTFPMLLDPGAAVQRLYGILGYPTSFFVDRDGVIRVHHIGVMTEQQLDRYLTELDLGT